jgi:hypothetical protein
MKEIFESKSYLQVIEDLKGKIKSFVGFWRGWLLVTSLVSDC